MGCEAATELCRSPDTVRIAEVLAVRHQSVAIFRVPRPTVFAGPVRLPLAHQQIRDDAALRSLEVLSTAMQQKEPDSIAHKIYKGQAVKRRVLGRFNSQGKIAHDLRGIEFR